jgi:ABC-type transporter Mla subunit MlaD
VELTTVHLWIAAILGDILLIAGVFALIQRWMANNVKKVLQETITPVDTKVTGLVQTAKDLGEIQAKHTNQLDALGSQVQNITYQVRPNRGSSLRDTADRTEQAVKEMDGKLDEALTDIAVLKSKVG